MSEFGLRDCKLKTILIQNEFMQMNLYEMGYRDEEIYKYDWYKTGTEGKLRCVYRIYLSETNYKTFTFQQFNYYFKQIKTKK